jgi:hypothetical protein
MKTPLVILAFLFSSCSTWLSTTANWEYDDMYIHRYSRPVYIYRDYWSPMNPYYQPYYQRPWNQYDRQNVIIIKPEVKPTTPVRRPTRGGSYYSPNSKTTRDRN